MLGDLGEQLNSLEDGGKNFLEQVMNYSRYSNQNNVFFLFHLTYILSRRNVWQLSKQRKDGLASDLLILCVLDTFTSRFYVFLRVGSD